MVSKIYTDKVLTGIMENPQIHSAVNVISFCQPCVLGVFLMVLVMVWVVGILGKDLNCAVNSLLTL